MAVVKHFTASAVIRHRGRVLLVWHNKLGMWLYPGGHIEPNETPDETVIREVREETGLDVGIEGTPQNDCASDAVAVLHSPAIIFDERIGNGVTEHHHIDLVYLCRPLGDTQVTLAVGEVGRYGWFGKDEVDSLAVPPNLKTFLRKVLQ